MNDRELLELAAKAAGYMVRSDLTYGDGIIINDGVLWNPLTDDGDALRLAVKLGMDVYVDTHPDGCQCVEAYSVTYDLHMKHRQIISIGSDPYAATRCAIVSSAAEIGKTM